MLGGYYGNVWRPCSLCATITQGLSWNNITAAYGRYQGDRVLIAWPVSHGHSEVGIGPATAIFKLPRDVRLFDSMHLLTILFQVSRVTQVSRLLMSDDNRNSPIQPCMRRTWISRIAPASSVTFLVC